jgi:hypothetical protein
MKPTSGGPRRGVAVALGLAAVVVLGACAQEPDRLDPGSAERQIAEAVAKVVSPPVVEVRCPSKVPLQQGHEFECDVVLGEPSGTLPVRVVQRDGVGTLDVLPQRAVLSAREIGDQLRDSLRKKFGRSFQVDCGKQAATVREPGEQLICRARDQMSRRSIAVTVTDERGSLTFEIADP